MADRDTWRTAARGREAHRGGERFVIRGRRRRSKRNRINTETQRHEEFLVGKHLNQDVSVSPYIRVDLVPCRPSPPIGNRYSVTTQCFPISSGKVRIRVSTNA